MPLQIGNDPFLIKADLSMAENIYRWGSKGFLIGGLVSLYTLNNNFTSRPLLTSLGTMLGKYALPIGTSAAVFASVTTTMDEWRGKDKAHTNAAVGGFVSGLVYGAKYKSPMKCINLGLNLAALAFVIRLGLTLEAKSEQKTQVGKLNEIINMRRYADLRG